MVEFVILPAGTNTNNVAYSFLKNIADSELNNNTQPAISFHSLENT